MRTSASASASASTLSMSLRRAIHLPSSSTSSILYRRFSAPLLVQAAHRQRRSFLVSQPVVPNMAVGVDVGVGVGVAMPRVPFNARRAVRADRFQDLVLALKEALGPSSGLTSDDIDVGHLMDVLRKYDTKEKGWVDYAMADPSLGYTRNLVDEGNGKSNLLVLVWTPGKGSPIHDHGNAHCIVKMLHGNLTETRYEFPDSDRQQPMRMISQQTLKENEVAYMADELGLHKMENPGKDYAISLHLYTPPNVAKAGCHTFNPITGKSSYVPKCGYYSKYKELVKDA